MDSGYSGPYSGLPIRRDEFNEVKEAMQSIVKRLDILEQVFVFVDFEQINQVLSKHNASLQDKVGMDSALCTGQWEAMPIREESRSKSPTESGGSCSPVQSCTDLRIQEKRDLLASHISSSSIDALGPRTGVADAVHESALDSTLASFSRPLDFSAKRPPKKLPPLVVPDTSADRTWDACSNATDEHERPKSSCSTWSHLTATTRSGWNDESEPVDPNVFKKFMSQALRPQWESKLQDAMLVQSIEEDHDSQEPTSPAGDARS